ncbi:hypothetical protein HNV12_02355 [Methanococcoides sp. SA1]|nr:hypothetical protein [Methanococcoides sp. SA1]
MKWKKSDERKLKEKYSSNIKLEDLSIELGKTIRAIKHKAARLELSRGKAPVNKPRNPNARKIAEKKYYEKNKQEIYANKVKRQKKRKLTLVNLLGGRCQKCGYNKCITALEFHHRENKDNNIAYIIKNSSEQKALKEIKKCVLLCANCHRELHNKGA